MGTRRSKHNKGRKPLYKEHRGTDGNNPQEIEAGRSFECITLADPNAFMESQALKTLSVGGVSALSEENCKILFENIRWAANGGKPFCPKCGCTENYHVSARSNRAFRYICRKCVHHYTPTSSTVFSGKKVGYKTLLLAILALIDNRLNQVQAGKVALIGKKSIHALSTKVRRLSVTTACNNASLIGRKFTLGSARYMGGALLSTRTWWSEPEKDAIENFAESAAPIERVAEALGRTATSIAWYARDMKVPLPSEWAALITPKRKLRTVREPTVVLTYPYIKKARPSDADLLKVNDLVPKSLPSWIRGDICQSIMLALYEGAVELADLQANKTKVAWFIKKFYQDQMPREEVSLEGRFADDDRDTYEIAAAQSQSEWDFEELNDRRHTFEAQAQTHTPTKQVSHLYEKEISAAHWQQAEKGIIYTRDEIEDLLDSGSIQPNIRAFENSSLRLHAEDRLLERYGIAMSREVSRKILAYCAASSPRMQQQEIGLYIVPISGKQVHVIYNRASNQLVTVLAPEMIDARRGFGLYADDQFSRDIRVGVSRALTGSRPPARLSRDQNRGHR